MAGFRTMKLYQIVAIIVVFLIIFVAFLLFSDKIIKTSLPSGYERIKTEYTKNEIKIYKNFYGIPHIIAQNEEDLFLAIGYYHASDRLWQMDYYRRLAQGRLSEVFGTQTLEVDRFLRCFEIDKIARECYEHMSQKSRTILQNYSRGINLYISRYKHRLPFEFGVLNYSPDEWMPYHSILIGRALTFELSLSIWADAAYGEIASKFGIDLAKLLIPDSDFKITQHDTYDLLNSDLNSQLEQFTENINKIRQVINIKGSSSGSNCWVYKNSDTSGTSSLLANDIHLPLSIPARWLQMQMTSPEINAIGLSLPGIPMILSGRNEYIAWGISNIMVDDFDYFIEKIENDYYYNSENDRAKLTYIKDTIKIKSKESYIYYQRQTNKSIIISDFHLNKYPELIYNNDKRGDTSFYSQNELSFKWIGSQISDEILTLYQILTASNFEDFSVACSNWSNPGLNFHYADKNGNIGLVSASDLPLRGTDCSPNIPNPAWLQSHNWVDIVRIENKHFSTHTDTTRFYASANQKFANSRYITNYWEPSSRYNRISEVLRNEILHKSREAQHLQNDYYSDYAKKLTDIIIPTLDKYTNLMNETELRVFNELNNWDYILLTDVGLSAFINIFIYNIINNMFSNIFSETLLQKFTFVTNIPTRLILEMLTNVKYEYYLNQLINSKIKAADYIIFETFRETIKYLIKYFNSSLISNWKYSELHVLILEHLLSKNSFLSPALNIGPFEMSGNNTTVNNTEWNFTKPYDVKIGASMRFIADLSEDFVYTVIPGGASGDPASANYSDQIRIWLNGGYVRLPFARKPAQTYKLSASIIPES